MGDVIKGEMMLSLYSSHKYYYVAFSLMKDLNSMFQVYMCDMVITLISCYKDCVHCLNWKSKGWDMVSLASF
jgi:hypothetical protein